MPPDRDNPDLPELTDDLLDVAEYRVGDRLVRPASGYLGPKGVVRGRPPERERAGWQSRINAALRKAVGL